MAVSVKILHLHTSGFYFVATIYKKRVSDLAKILLSASVLDVATTKLVLG